MEHFGVCASETLNNKLIININNKSPVCISVLNFKKNSFKKIELPYFETQDLGQVTEAKPITFLLNPDILAECE